MSKEAMKLALEALEGIHPGNMTPMAEEYWNKAITALREVPAAPTTTEANGGKTGWPPGLLQDDSKGLSKWLSNQPDAKRRVREALAAPVQQEPVAWRLWDKDPLGGTDHRWAYYDKSDFANGVDPTKHFKVEPLYTSPPAQRKPLTDMQVDGEWILVRDLDTNDVEKSRLFARAIESAHGIKENT